MSCLFHQSTEVPTGASQQCQTWSMECLNKTSSSSSCRSSRHSSSSFRGAPSPPLDNIQVMMIVWRLRGNIIMLDCATQCSQSAAHLYEHWAVLTGQTDWVCHIGTLRGGCLELYYCNMVEWFWWDSSLIWRPTGFLQCFDTVGLIIWPVKIVPEMTCVVWVTHWPTLSFRGGVLRWVVFWWVYSLCGAVCYSWVRG